MLSRKYYKMIAKVMNDLRPIQTDLENKECFIIRKRQWEKTVLKLCEIFKQDNPRFDSQKFINACYGK
ncbi:MAG TPA: hypothetical protein ENG63_09700 [Candidatus Desulfofervidus auxilii]|uniref:Uncharacterized protein n=1 Tax=Desulfofervidus auxilii TaxID=1621989 RepID=A0A7C0U3U9_DESA2|nr:hypothetical protein [Candidatus Desulfofervidus auxilii]